MTADRFPSVRTLGINANGKECVYQNGSPLPIILSRSWPSVTQLNLAGNIKRDDHSYIASALPNLITLNYSSNADSHDLADLVPKFKFLQVLALDNYYREHNPEPSTIIMPKKVMNRLRLIKVYKLTLTVDMVRFIFYFCPDLVELNLDDCTVSKDVIEHANRISRTMKSPVRQLKLMGFSQTKPDLWVEFISEFRNLKEIFIDNACAGADHLEVVLTERLSHVKVTQYRG
ncbi:hypothetical protein GQ42DRAFT_165875 [Ramicandelaber brevisporus]|nr:hypothetical protein GQ42DRAFT_165875 [Ramicandelaber brevisporus]